MPFLLFSLFSKWGFSVFQKEGRKSIADITTLVGVFVEWTLIWKRGFISESYADQHITFYLQVCRNTEVAGRVESQLKLVIRPMYSSPPIHGASIVATILKDRSFRDFL